MFSKTENQKVHFLYEFHIKKAHLPNRRVIDDLYSPHTFSLLHWLAGKSLFPLFIYYYDYVTKMFTLLSFSVSSRQQLCFVCNQSKRKKNKQERTLSPWDQSHRTRAYGTVWGRGSKQTWRNVVWKVVMTTRFQHSKIAIRSRLLKEANLKA